MRALDIKLLRDLWHLRGQALAIALVITAGVATFIMFLSTLDSLRLTQAEYYQDYRFAEVFASLKRAPQSLARRIAEIPGVERVETRVTTLVNLDIPDFPEPVTGQLVSIPDHGEPLMNKLHLRQGRIPEPGRDDEVLISVAFAEAHRFVPGDKLNAIINGKRKALTIVGTALSPEYIYQLRPGSAFPDYQRYGILWMGRTALGNAYDMDGAFNNVVLSLTTDASEKDVIDRLDDLIDPYGGRGAYSRVDQFSNRFLTEEFKQLENNARMFPVIFLGIAIFLLNVVLARMIHMQREQIAALKAFGYTNRAVALHYFKLVMVIVVLGVAAGVLAGIWLGKGMSAIYMDFFSFPFLHFQLRPQVVLSAALTSAGGALVATLFAVRAAARLRPAEAMRPEAPTQYRESFIERLGFKRFLNHPTRMIVRHILRRPVKSALTMLGIAFACGIMMTGRFQQDTVSYMMGVEYGLMQREDVSVAFFDPTSRRAQYELQSLAGVEHVEVFRSVPARLHFAHRSHRTGITGVEPGGDIQRLLDADLKPIALPAAGIVLTDYLGEMLGVGVGDTLMVEILEGTRPVREVPVVGLVKEYLGVSAYMELSALNRLLHEGPAISGAYLAVDDEYLLGLFQRFKETPRIAAVMEREQEIRNFNRTMDQTMLFITTVATTFSVVIAFGVVYNSARIALTERARELASLRVLGFTRGEIAYILLGELAVLTAFAIPIGFLVGRALCGIIALGLQSELYRVPLILEPKTYAFAATVVLIATVISALVVRRHLDRLDLIGVLKTKE
ncbi:MAG: ABC transporter permease [Pseudomonadota bacterium]